MTTGTHEFDDDPRNAGILVSVNGELKPRAEAVVSVCGEPGAGKLTERLRALYLDLIARSLTPIKKGAA